MLKVILILCLAAFGGASALRALAEERLNIEPVDYANGAAACAAWSACEGAGQAALAPEKTPDGRPALAFTADMAKLDTRAYWDRQVRLDLARYGRVALWIKVVGDSSAIASCTLYFNAGGGWYGAPFGPPERAWRKVVLDRSEFLIEDRPEGWSSVRSMRLSFWRGRPRKATVYVGGVEAIGYDVAVVRNSRAGSEAAPAAAEMVQQLAHAGIDAGAVEDVDVEKGALRGMRLVVYPYNPKTTDAELDALDAYVKQGGKLLVCYSLPDRVGRLLGIENVRYRSEERKGQFSSMRFVSGALAGLPASITQHSWNIELVKPAAPDTRVIAEWYDDAGKPTGAPAVVYSPRGAYVSHVLLDEDPADRDRALRAIAGALVPPIWHDVAKNALEGASRLGARTESFAEAVARTESLAQKAGKQAAVSPLLDRARAAFREGQAQFEAGKYAESIGSATAARDRLLAAYARAQTARRVEFRGMWCHSAYGPEGMNWDQALAKMKAAGCNAIVPNMLWGGVADYPSKVLPVRDTVATRGDAIAECLAAARKHGLEIHVWKVNWNLGGAPKEFVERMRAEKRLQRNSDGVEEAWLCPSNDANFELERDSMLEIVRNYAVDGIHFDYIRYPDSTKCYCDGCRQRFEAKTGKVVERWPADVLRKGPRYAEYQQFRRDNITRLVKAVSEEAHRIRPGIKVSAAVFPNWPSCREEIGQDWGLWAKSGWLDFVCPMDYTASDEEFRTRVQVQRDELGGRVPLYPGIGASAPGLSPAQVIDQVQIAREEGADGFIIFHLADVTAAQHLPALAAGATAGPSEIPHRQPRASWGITVDGAPLREPPMPLQTVTVAAGVPDRAGAGEWQLVVTHPDGSVAAALGKAQAGRTAKGNVRLDAGLYRLVLRRVGSTAPPSELRGPFFDVRP